jgi:secondary thiamine-phosphate synthase enzyme
MKLHSETISTRTQEVLQFVDITYDLESLVKRSGITTGFVLLRSRHTTAAITCNESDPDLHQDARELLEHLFPRNRKYHHDYESPDNARAHLAEMLGFGHSTWVPVRDAKLDLGTWQRIYLVELEQPRTRRVDCIVVGEVDRS